MLTARFRLATLAAVALGSAALLLAGPLDPPAGPVAPTYKTLTEVEPRYAINATNTPGDADSSFKITKGSSFYLTDDFTGEANKKGIEIAIGPGQQATIDLNGFTLTGMGASSTKAAIYIDGVGANVVVRNGAIRDWRQAIQHFVGGSITVEDVHAYGSQLTQFDVRNATMVRCFADDGASTGFLIDSGVMIDCTARSNTGSGFTINSAATIARGCVAIGNANNGFSLGQGVAESCRAESNGWHGFANPGAMTNCTALSNGGDGVAASFSCAVRGCTIVGNQSDGVSVAGPSRIEGNTITSNTAHGVSVTGSRVTVVNNTISTNGRGAGAFAGVYVAGNDACIDGNHISEMLLGGDDVGVWVTGSSDLIVRSQLSALSTNLSIVAGNTSGGSSSTPSTAGAWVNITY